MREGAGSIRRMVRDSYGTAIERRAAGRSSVADTVTDMTRSNYDSAALEGTGEAAEHSFGCGNPVEAARLVLGERVLDLGCGAGLDLILAARAVGERGLVYGLDMTPGMLARARRNLERLGLRNVVLLRGCIEDLPLYDGSADVLISNCVINLSPDKEAVFSEAARVLAPGGRFCVSDIVLLKPVPERLRMSPSAWSGWLAGALPLEEYKAGLERAGFFDVCVVPTKPHEVNAEILSQDVGALSEEELLALKGLSSSALITALRP